MENLDDQMEIGDLSTGCIGGVLSSGSRTAARTRGKSALPSAGSLKSCTKRGRVGGSLSFGQNGCWERRVQPLWMGHIAGFQYASAGKVE